MHLHVHRLILVAVLLFAVPAFAQGPQGHYFPGGQLTGGGNTSGNFSNLVAGPGGIQITGGSHNGSDQISNVNVNGVRNALAFGGTDIGQQVNAAIQSLGLAGGAVYIPAGSYTFNTTIVCPETTDSPIIITGAASTSDYAGSTHGNGTILVYTGNTDAVRQMMVGNQNARGCELRDLTLDGGSAGSNAVGFHFGGTIYSKTQTVMIRNFANAGIELDNEPDPQEPTIGAHWTERFDFHQTAFSADGTEIWFHGHTGQLSSMDHGRMDIHVGLFGTERGILIDGGAVPDFTTFDINGNHAGTGSLVKVITDATTGGTTIEANWIMQWECQASSGNCPRFDIDPGSQLAGILDGFMGPFYDIVPAGAQVHMASRDNRFFGPVHTSCYNVFSSVSAGASIELFTVVGWGAFADGLLAVNSRYSGNATNTLYGLAASSCSSNPSLTVVKTTQYAGGAPFTVTETCHPTDVVGGGTPTYPQYPQGSTTYAFINNSGQTVTMYFSFMNMIRDPSSVAGVIGPLSLPTQCQ